MKTPAEYIVDVPGGRVWTGIYGDGKSTPLLVLHGGPGMPSFYLEPLTGLADDRPVILYDQLGCGRSERPNDSSLWTASRSVAEVEAVRQGLGLGRVHVLGHSWGGFLALAYAEQHPQSITSLVLSSPLVSTAGWMTDAMELLSRLPGDVRATIAAHERERTYGDPAYVKATKEFYQRFFCRLHPWPEVLERTFRELGQGPYNTMWGPSEFTQTGNLRGADLTETLSDLRVPSLWIGGSQDEVSPIRLEVFAQQAGGQMELVKGGSHCLHLEQTDRYLAVVRAFLRSADAG